MANSSVEPSIEAPSRQELPLSHRLRFYLMASITLSFLAGSSIPTPIYPIYQAEWHFSSVTITFIFAVYALSVLASLLVCGRVSDYVGRRPVLLIATVMQIVAMYLMGAADGLADLIGGRVLQGLSTGAAVAAVGAGLIDIDKPRGEIANAIAPVSGSAVGALVGSVIVQFLPFPTHTVFALLGGLFALQLGCVLAMKETTPTRPGALRSLIPKFGVPAQVRPAMLVASAVFFAGWALAGFCASLGPGLIKSVFDLSASLVGGLALATFSGSGVAAILALKSRPAATQTYAGCFGLLAGMSLMLGSLQVNSITCFFSGVLVAGAGFGAGFQGGIRMVVARALPHQLAGVLSVAFVCCYLGMGVPVIVAGYENASGVEIIKTAQVFGALIIGLILLAVLGLTFAHRADR